MPKRQLNTVELLKDRKDYRNSLIHRIANSHHKGRIDKLEKKLSDVEATINMLKRDLF